MSEGRQPTKLLQTPSNSRMLSQVNVLTIDVAPEMSSDISSPCSGHSENSSADPQSGDSHQHCLNIDLTESCRSKDGCHQGGEPDCFYFSTPDLTSISTRNSRTKSGGTKPLPGSPPMKDMMVHMDLKKYCDGNGSSGSIVGRNHRIYAIDELSEVSGRSDAVQMNERSRMDQVHQILVNQEKQARRDRPKSRLAAHKETKGNRQVFSPLHTPPYGAESPEPSNRPSFRKCRILIPPNQPGGDDKIYSQAYDAFIFDLDLPSPDPSVGTSIYPTRRALSCRTMQQQPPSSSQRPSVGGGGGGVGSSSAAGGHSSAIYSSYGAFNAGQSTHMLTRGHAIAQTPSRTEAESTGSCCACFGFSRGRKKGSQQSATAAQSNTAATYVASSTLTRKTASQSRSRASEMSHRHSDSERLIE